ncbi:polysaccharide deacetylase family protein [Streptomyces qinzhouensis]|uniref:polysaccharide deacetylase family protein n=1 Tax=Streptomyces qinzhouensis TaxID=2599401 RepID=UPI001FE252FF|nr:polysaccharide deacetylase family protein [Streptomyces qinzhouensis]
MILDQKLYDYSPVTERPPLRWPGGARVAFYVGLNIEHYRLDAPSTSTFPGTAGLVPDPLNYGWRDYGPRVGIWRVIESLDRHGIRASALLNSAAGERYPQIVEAGRARDWAWLAHGRDNSTFHSDMTAGEERRMLASIVGSIERTTGRRPRGWMGPALTQTFRTPELLAELGLSYVLDWTNDDQPYRLNVPGMLSVPYSVELNDIGLFVGKGMTGPDFVRVVKDQLDRLHADSTADSGRVMALALHPFVVGQPFRSRYLDEALEYVARHPGVWLTTSDEIAEHYARTAPAAAVPGAEVTSTAS